MSRANASALSTRPLRRIGTVCCLLTPYLLCLLLSASPVRAEESLLVGVNEKEPFVFLDGHEPRGYSIELWEEVARQLGLDFHYIRSKNIAGEIEDVLHERVDVAIGGIALSKERELQVDFTHPYFHTGLGILVRTDRSFSLPRFLQTVLNKNKLNILLYFLGVIVVAGHLIWLAERRANSGKRSFNRNYLPGVFEGMYWSVVTASTVGYGDRVPTSWAGRILALCIIVTTLPLFAFFVAELSSNITLYELRSQIQSPRDLIERRVGVLAEDVSQDYAQRLGAVAVPFDTMDEAYTWLLKGRLDAVVFDRPNLRYFARTEGRGRVEVVGAPFAPQEYAMALPQGSPLRERLDRVLLQLRESGWLDGLQQEWFGQGN